MALLPEPPPPAPTPQRILDAALDQAERTGLRRITMDDVARRAGLARITLYGHFRTKDALIRAALMREVERFLADLDSVARSYEDPEERLVETFAEAVRSLRSHRLLNRTLDSEPDILLPHIGGESPILALARGWLAEQVRSATVDTDLADIDPHAAAELIVRLVQSLLLSPDSVFDLDHRDGARRLARRWIVPALPTAADRQPA